MCTIRKPSMEQYRAEVWYVNLQEVESVKSEAISPHCAGKASCGMNRHGMPVVSCLLQPGRGGPLCHSRERSLSSLVSNRATGNTGPEYFMVLREAHCILNTSYPEFFPQEGEPNVCLGGRELLPKAINGGHLQDTGGPPMPSSSQMGHGTGQDMASRSSNP